MGSGIGGAEAALTLAAGLPDAKVTLVGRWPSLRIMPDLVYVPFGVSAQRIDVPLTELAPYGVTPLTADVTGVDVHKRLVHTSAGELEFDVLVAAPGAAALDKSGRALRSLDDAQRVRGQFEQIIEAARNGKHQTITIHSEAENSWTAPACELALLMGAAIRSMGLDRRVETFLATADRDVFEWFGPIGEVAIESALRRSRVQIATGVPPSRFDALGGDLVVAFGALQARHIHGLPGRAPSGWYHTGPSFEVARNVFVIGDATNLPYRAGFATAWQARRVLRALGGDIKRLGKSIDGIPIGSVEYQMDLADSVLRARIDNADMLNHPFLGHDAEIEVVAGARPEKLVGLLVHDRVLRRHRAMHDAPLAFRDLLRERAIA